MGVEGRDGGTERGLKKWTCLRGRTPSLSPTGRRLGRTSWSLELSISDGRYCLCVEVLYDVQRREFGIGLDISL